MSFRPPMTWRMRRTFCMCLKQARRPPPPSSCQGRAKLTPAKRSAPAALLWPTSTRSGDVGALCWKSCPRWSTLERRPGRRSSRRRPISNESTEEKCVSYRPTYIRTLLQCSSTIIVLVPTAVYTYYYVFCSLRQHSYTRTYTRSTIRLEPNMSILYLVL